MDIKKDVSAKNENSRKTIFFGQKSILFTISVVNNFIQCLTSLQGIMEKIIENMISYNVKKILCFNNL